MCRDYSLKCGGNLNISIREQKGVCPDQIIFQSSLSSHHLDQARQQILYNLPYASKTHRLSTMDIVQHYPCSAEYSLAYKKSL